VDHLEHWGGGGEILVLPWGGLTGGKGGKTFKGTSAIKKKKRKEGGNGKFEGASKSEEKKRENEGKEGRVHNFLRWGHRRGSPVKMEGKVGIFPTDPGRKESFTLVL